MRELEDKLRVLEPKKACGVDSILNEMLKHTDQRFKLAMLKLFNDVLCVGFFPEIWNKGLISPIHKSGDKLDPNNYRGICVNSNLGKVLCSILNTRLLHFLMKHNALSKCLMPANVRLKLETKEPNSSPGAWSETGLQFKPHPLQHLHQPIGQHIRTRPHSRSHSTRHRDKVSSLRR